MLVHSMSIFFDPIYLAAAFLDFTKKNLIEQNPKLFNLFPETIAGHKWFHFVDPGIDDRNLQLVSDCLKTEVTFIQRHFSISDKDLKIKDNCTINDKESAVDFGLVNETTHDGEDVQ